MMKICVVLVVTLVHLGCSEIVHQAPGTDQSTTDVSSQTGVPVNSMGHCFFGDFPSASCMFNCFMKGSSPFCGNMGWCFCSSEEDDKADKLPHPPTHAPTLPTDSEELEDHHDDVHEAGTKHLTFFFFDLGSLFGGDNGTDVLSATSSPMTPVSSSNSSPWTLPHILAVVILMMLTILVTLEVRACCKQRAKRQLSIQSVLYPPEHEKAQLG